jgi:hypothetical protein
VEDLRDVLQKAGEELPPNHALIRGLRRGIAIYTNEPGFSCYRRQVQILAQKGKIAVVFSDEALAYGRTSETSARAKRAHERSERATEASARAHERSGGTSEAGARAK